MAVSILSVRDLRKSFGNLHALDGVSLDVPERKISILIGPNGSGKTTLINVISGVYKPESGKVLFRGQDVTNLPPHKVYRMGMARTFQIPALFLKLNVLENLLVAEKNNPGETFSRFLLRRFWQDREKHAIKKASRILEFLGLSGLWNRPTTDLSGGQLKLVEIGRALMSDAELLLLDEPVSGVNPTLAHEVFSRILKLRDEYGVTFFIVEHRLDIALKYVDEMFVMSTGRLVASGMPEDVMKNRQVIDAYLGG